MSTADTARASVGARTSTFGEFFKVWLKIGLINFGGPAGQIAMMHRIVVDEKKWIEEERFLHALNFCMLLPGPEAQKLATYIGWLLHGVRGGLVSGILFVLPGALVMLGLSLLYALGRGVPLIDGALFGIKAAVLVIVLEALWRIGKRALKTQLLIALAGLAFVGIFFLALPFPLIVGAAALIGYVVSRTAPERLGLSGQVQLVETSIGNPWRQFMLAGVIGLILWWTPVAVAAMTLGPGHVLVSIGTFFSKLAVVSFGGAYAVLAYMAQQAVETHHWMTAPEMVDGLGLAETTPGPLILVTQFVGFLAGFRNAAPFSPVVAGVLGAAMTTWVTFVPLNALDLRRRAVCRAIAGEPGTFWRIGSDHGRGGRRHPQPVGLVCAARLVRPSRGAASRYIALVCVRSAGARFQNRGLGGDCGRTGILVSPRVDRGRGGDGGARDRGALP